MAAMAAADGQAVRRPPGIRAGIRAGVREFGPRSAIDLASFARSPVVKFAAAVQFTGIAEDVTVLH